MPSRLSPLVVAAVSAAAAAAADDDDGGGGDDDDNDDNDSTRSPVKGKTTHVDDKPCPPRYPSRRY